MAPFERLRAGLLLAALAMGATCVPLVEESDRPCPCSGNYSCCAATQMCLLPGDTCPNSGGGGALAGTTAGGGFATPGGRGAMATRGVVPGGAGARGRATRDTQARGAPPGTGLMG